MIATGIGTQTGSRMSTTLRAGLLGGVVGALTSWIYELIVWVRLLHLDQRLRHRENTAVLSFGPRIRSLGATAFALGVCIHFPDGSDLGNFVRAHLARAARRSIEATLAALFYGIFAWVVMTM